VFCNLARLLWNGCRRIIRTLVHRLAQAPRSLLGRICLKPDQAPRMRVRGILMCRCPPPAAEISNIQPLRAAGVGTRQASAQGEVDPRLPAPAAAKKIINELMLAPSLGDNCEFGLGATARWRRTA